MLSVNMPKPIHIVLPGGSIRGLEENITRVNQKYPDVMYASVNRFFVLEEKILHQIGREFDYFYYSDPHRLIYYLGIVRDFLNRPGKNHFISDYSTMKDIERHGVPVVNVNGTVTYSSYNVGKNVKVKDQFYNSLTCVFLTLISMGFREFVLFGADGYGDYFGLNSQYKDGFHISKSKEALIEDADFMNAYFWKLVEDITPDPVKILNIGMESSLTCFPKQSYEEFLA